MSRVIHEDVDVPPDRPGVVNNFADILFRVSDIQENHCKARSLLIRDGEVIKASLSAYSGDRVIAPSEDRLDKAPA